MEELEIRRRMFHLVNGFILVALIYYDIVNALIAFIIFLFLLVLGLVIKRVKIPMFYWFFEKFDRPKDFKILPGKGSIFYMLGASIVLFLFSAQKEIAMASIIIMAVGDSMAAIIGQYGSVEHPFNKKKYLEGSIGGALLAGIAAAMFVSPLEAGVAAVAAMIAEGIDLKLGVNQIDDNIVMPIIAGAVIWLMRLI